MSNTSKNTIHILQEITDGIAQDPEAFYCEQLAGIRFQNIVTNQNVGFRVKNDNETWIDYHVAFAEYSHGTNLPYNTDDWELQWYRSTPKDNQLIDVAFETIYPSYDQIEVHPCRYIDQESIEQCEPSEAHFWSAYIHLSEGGLDCIADFVTQELAQQFQNFLASA